MCVSSGPYLARGKLLRAILTLIWTRPGTCIISVAGSDHKDIIYIFDFEHPVNHG